MIPVVFERSIYPSEKSGGKPPATSLGRLTNPIRAPLRHLQSNTLPLLPGSCCLNSQVRRLACHANTFDAASEGPTKTSFPGPLWGESPGLNTLATVTSLLSTICFVASATGGSLKKPDQPSVGRRVVSNSSPETIFLLVSLLLFARAPTPYRAISSSIHIATTCILTRRIWAISERWPSPQMPTHDIASSATPPATTETMSIGSWSKYESTAENFASKYRLPDSRTLR